MSTTANRYRDMLGEAERQRDEAKYAPVGDNHHNAAACPYCRPQFDKRIERLTEALRKYGRHDAAAYCPAATHPHDACTCGLAALIAEEGK